MRRIRRVDRFPERAWVKPSGIHDLSGDTSFCNQIRSTDSSHVSQSRADAPAVFGAIASAVACARAAGDVVNISGIDGLYSASDDRHTIKTDNFTITPSFALHSGTDGNPTIIQEVPGDPYPDWRVPKYDQLAAESLPQRLTKLAEGFALREQTTHINATVQRAKLRIVRAHID